MIKNNERWSIFLFLIVFILAVVEFKVLPDGIALRLFGGLRHYYRMKPLFMIVPVLIGSAGSGMVHHGTVRKGMIIYGISIAIFAVNLIFQL